MYSLYIYILTSSVFSGLPETEPTPELIDDEEYLSSEEMDDENIPGISNYAP